MSKSKHPKKEGKKTAKSVVGVPGQVKKPESKTHRVARGKVIRQAKPIGRCGHELTWVKLALGLKTRGEMVLWCETCCELALFTTLVEGQ